MAGNEINLINYLFKNMDQIALSHLGLVREIGAPTALGYSRVNNLGELLTIKSEDARKKADVYINGYGVSIKQTGGSFSFNRLQRANLQEVFTNLGFGNPQRTLQRTDEEVWNYHKGLVPLRNRPWNIFFSEVEFKSILEFLMLKGSPNYGISNHPADLILEAPATSFRSSNINVYTFDEYFNTHKNKFMIAIRRQWVGQASKSENGRACSLAKKAENLPWVFNNVVGEPRTGWSKEFDTSQRKTVYFLMIEKIK